MKDSRIIERGTDHLRGFSTAKLNLFLEITGRFPDGYHELSSVFHEIDLADEVEVRICRDAIADQLHCDGIPLGITQSNNLVMRTVESVRQVRPELPPVSIRLTKKIPPGSGLGGGSSNAAFLLAALNDLAALDMSTDQLLEISRSLGSDVPFFLNGGSALCRARGDEITTLAGIPRLFFSLIRPPFSLSTVEVYRHVTLTSVKREVMPFIDNLREGREDHVPAFNRLEAAAFLADSRVQEFREQLLTHSGVQWTLTGTGSVFFSASRNIERLRQETADISKWGGAEVLSAQSFLRGRTLSSDSSAKRRGEHRGDH